MFAPQPPQQLDIFAHSRDVMLRNDVLHALDRRDAAGARAAWLTLAGEFPADPDLPPLDVLASALAAPCDTALPDHDALARERHRLTHDVAGAARQALGAATAEPWLRPMWHALAVRCAGLPFQAVRPDDHAAALWLRGAHWAQAAQAVQGIESWRRIPAPLAWMVETRCRLGELDACWALLAELAWLAPGRLEDLLRRPIDPLLARLHTAFDRSFEGVGGACDLPWFPAWVLTHTPALAPHLALAQPSQHTDAERGMRLVLDLLSLERQGRHNDLVQRRRALRDLHAPLYAAYMATR
jgi:hypothetical protein